MTFRFCFPLIGGLMVLGIIWNGYKYHGNPIFADYNIYFWILSVLMFILAYWFYREENG
ncbi:MAG: hypothetical protein AABX83_01635 [Nanoarchaeota archaeon]